MAAPLVKRLCRGIESRRAPDSVLEPEGLAEILYKYASDEQLKFIHEPEKIITDNYDVS